MIARFAAALHRHRPIFRIAFWLYAITLFFGTHWPALEVRVPYVERPDLFVHFAIFGAWLLLFWSTAYAGEPLTFRTILIAAVISCLYAGLDEGLQAIPWVRRHCAWDDFFANCTGIVLAAILASALTVLTRRPPR